MLLTLKKAQGMSCPHQFARGMACHGANCMAWRWANVVNRNFREAQNPKALTELEAGPRTAPDCWEFFAFDPAEDVFEAGWLEPRADADARRLGFCGLAGTPIDFS